MLYNNFIIIEKFYLNIILLHIRTQSTRRVQSSAEYVFSKLQTEKIRLLENFLYTKRRIRMRRMKRRSSYTLKTKFVFFLNERRIYKKRVYTVILLSESK